MATIRAVVTRGVFARKKPGEPVKPHGEGEILELTPLDFAELRASNYVEKAPPEAKPAALELPLEQQRAPETAPRRARA